VEVRLEEAGGLAGGGAEVRYSAGGVSQVAEQKPKVGPQLGVPGGRLEGALEARSRLVGEAEVPLGYTPGLQDLRGPGRWPPRRAFQGTVCGVQGGGVVPRARRELHALEEALAEVVLKAWVPRAQRHRLLEERHAPGEVLGGLPGGLRPKVREAFTEQHVRLGRGGGGAGA
jgi:hypothetical protein